ncbi:MAG: hypothetical protein P0Y53_14560 [Candidatus Pseudobacter hemicellulosilyticus]|uniref:PKD domain-containing protein n=1 Tax=Candidatus Pseudobacter hemicellulosilyticus TaxID=3121375 RepID=A0AAJ6BDJ8_9BACT|nr:MAG: hypothetical protein P0Y53_14560 [Pseudobacter sp.]
MKKYFWLLLVFPLAVLSGCYKDDIDDLRKDVDELKAQLARYEILMDALNKRLYITDYTLSGDKYFITLSDGTLLNVSNSPAFLSVSTTNTWLINGVDSKIAATDDIPALSIGANKHWLISGADTGIPANTSINPDVNAIIAIVQKDELMTFIFSNGKTIQLKSLAPEVSITVPAGGFVISKYQWLRVSAGVEYGDGASFAWTLGADTLSRSLDLLAIFDAPGTYLLKFTAQNGIGAGFREVAIKVNDASYVNGVNRVFEFAPAPGQFVHELPTWKEGDDAEAMRLKAESSLKSNIMIHLGGFGGYVVMGFDHTIVNKPGQPSFQVNGNAFANWAEPGVIEVSYDANGNGLPDDTWYEIAGSEYNSEKTVKNYTITYHKPDENKEPVTNEENPFMSDIQYIRWTDNKGGLGYVSKNTFHSQPYYPQWQGESISFTGTKLTEDNVADLSGTGSYFVNPAFPFGYADNWSNGDERAKIRIDWAVDKTTGQSIQLKGVDFIKVYTGQRAEAGWLGEVSTEVSGVKDLNIP